MADIFASPALADKRMAFVGHLRALDVLPDHHLLRVVRSADIYSPRVRTAALRHLVARAPLEITRGQPFATRRRYVRAFYKI